jgi:hypothetical protein
MRHIVILILLYATNAFGSNREKLIRKFVEAELKYYPKAHLTDLYKNYIQDAYGPGHLIPDTTSAGSYLDWELQQTDWIDPLPYQALGINNDFYRINLILIKNKAIPRDTLLMGMVASARLARNPDIDSWEKEWAEVFEVINRMKPELTGLKEDEELIEKTLAKGVVVMHHSEHYEKTYHPHYRIIHRSVFERWRGNYFS